MRLFDNREASFSCEATINFEALEALTDQSNNSMYTLYKQVEKQNRTHRKKRINKKYAKRYGYHTEDVKMFSGRTTVKSGDDGTVEFVVVPEDGKDINN